MLLHYPDAKSNLSQLFFLDPEWLCSLMAQIITVTEVNPLIDKQGVRQHYCTWGNCFFNVFNHSGTSIDSTCRNTSVRHTSYDKAYCIHVQDTRNRFFPSSLPPQLLQVRSLPHLLKEPKFPSEFMPEYVRLLERFEVVLSQTPHTLLIPSRLAKKKPSSLALPPASAGGETDDIICCCCCCCCCCVPPGSKNIIIHNGDLLFQRV